MFLFWNLKAIAQIENLNPLIQSGQYASAERLLLTLKNRTEEPEQLSDINHRLGELHYQYTHQYDQALIAFEDIIRLSTLTDDRYLAPSSRDHRRRQSDDAADELGGCDQQAD